FSCGGGCVVWISRQWRWSSALLSSLPYLARDLLADVADSLALVGLGRPALSNPRSDLPDGLLVDPANDHLRRHRYLELDSVGRVHLDGVRVPERQLEPLALQLCAVADPLDLQPL